MIGVSVVTAVLLGVLIILAVAAYRRRGDAFWAVMATLAGGGLVLVLLLKGVDGDVFVSLEDVPIALVAAVAGAEFFGLPRPLAVRLGIGFRSRQWEYDRTLTALLGPLNVRLGIRPESELSGDMTAWRTAVMKDGRARLQRLKRLQPPDDPWRALTTSYASIYTAILDAIAEGDTVSDPQTVASMTSAANQERERLRARYQSEAAALLQKSRVTRILRGRR